MGLCPCGLLRLAARGWVLALCCPGVGVTLASPCPVLGIRTPPCKEWGAGAREGVLLTGTQGAPSLTPPLVRVRKGPFLCSMPLLEHNCKDRRVLLPGTLARASVKYISTPTRDAFCPAGVLQPEPLGPVSAIRCQGAGLSLPSPGLGLRYEGQWLGFQDDTSAGTGDLCGARGPL